MKTNTASERAERVRTRDALKIQIETLKTLGEPMYPVKFNSLLMTILDLGVMSAGWRAAFERVYEKFPEDKRIFVRNEMTEMYCRLGEYTLAARFLAPHPITPWELEQALRVNLELHRLEEASAVANRCRAQLRQVEGREGEKRLRELLEFYYRSLGQWEPAAAVWDEARLSESVNPFFQAAQLHLRRAGHTVRKGLTVIRKYQEQERKTRGGKRRNRSFFEEEQALKKLDRMLGRVSLLPEDAAETRPASENLPVFSPPYDANRELHQLITSLENQWAQRQAQTEGGQNAGRPI